jgi:hypothetical protein
VHTTVQRPQVRDRGRARSRTPGMRAALAFAAMLAAGCGGAAPAGGPARGFTRPPAVVDCAQRVEGQPGWPHAGWRRHAVFAGPVAFFGLRDSAHQQPFREGGVGTLTPLLVAAGRQVTVVARTGGVRMRWGDVRRDRRALTFKACPARERSLAGHGRVGRFTQFLGGFGAARVGCVAIDVYADGRARPYRRRFALGARCG